MTNGPNGHAAAVEAIHGSGRRFLVIWTAGILAFYLAAGIAGVRVMRASRAETKAARQAWLASVTAPPEDGTQGGPDGGGAAVVAAGIHINRIGDFQLREATWLADFDVWFRWTNDELRPGESFGIVNGEMEEPRLVEAAVVDGTRYERYRVRARMDGSIDPSRFPLGDYGLVIQIEDQAHDLGSLRYVADRNPPLAGDQAVPRGLMVRKDLVGVRTHSETGGRGDPRYPDSQLEGRSRLVAGLLVAPAGISVYLTLFQALFASVAISLLVFFIRPTHVDPRFGLPVGAFFAVVGNNIYLASILPRSSGVSLANLVNAAGVATVFLALVQSTISLHLLDNLGRERLSRIFDRISFVVILLGWLAVNIAFPLAARP